jgi:hypothetical protein
MCLPWLKYREVLWAEHDKDLARKEVCESMAVRNAAWYWVSYRNRMRVFGLGLSGSGCGWERTIVNTLRKFLFCEISGKFLQQLCYCQLLRPGRGVDHPPRIAPRLKEEYSYISIPTLGLHGVMQSEYILKVLANNLVEALALPLLDANTRRIWLSLELIAFPSARSCGRESVVSIVTGYRLEGSKPGEDTTFFPHTLLDGPWGPPIPT